MSKSLILENGSKIENVPNTNFLWLIPSNSSEDSHVKFFDNTGLTLTPEDNPLVIKPIEKLFQKAIYVDTGLLVQNDMDKQSFASSS